ncbi:MAG: hypothetical protein JSV79_02180, partial [Armatimonadota bacterium]
GELAGALGGAVPAGDELDVGGVLGFGPKGPRPAAGPDDSDAEGMLGCYGGPFCRQERWACRPVEGTTRLRVGIRRGGTGFLLGEGPQG